MTRAGQVCSLSIISADTGSVAGQSDAEAELLLTDENCVSIQLTTDIRSMCSQ